jgi:hypothetical protein
LLWPQSSPDDMETIAGCLSLPMAWPRLSDFHGSRLTFISCRMSSWVVRLGIRSVASLCSGNDSGCWEYRCRTPLLAVMVFHSRTLLTFHRGLGSDDRRRVDDSRNLLARNCLCARRTQNGAIFHGESFLTAPTRQAENLNSRQRPRRTYWGPELPFNR